MADTNASNSWTPKEILRRIFGRGGQPRPSKPLIVPRAEHNISRKNMDEEVIKVLYRLHNSGHKGYLVGGAVRDLLLERKPKDYDVATDARPDQIKKLFRNSRLIGRRFRLAHIVFKGGKVVEVSTFRRTPDRPDAEGGGEEDLMIREDNTWGTPQQDAFRRDFTVNGLFYNIADFSVIDYVGGLADLKDDVIRAIGDADIRFREDPVRMVRAVEYAARLDFTIHPATWRAIRKHKKDLKKASEMRVTDELLHLLKSGAAEKAFRLMHEAGLLEILHPGLAAALEDGQAERFYSELSVVDEWVLLSKQMRDVALYSVLFYPIIRQRVAAAEEKKGGRLSKGEYLDHVRSVLEEATTLYQIPNRREHQLRQAMLAARKMRRKPSRHRGLRSMVDKAYFLNALALLELEVEAKKEHREVLAEWHDLKRKAEEEGRITDPDEKRGRRRSGKSRRTGKRRDEKKDRRDRKEQESDRKKERRGRKQPEERPSRSQEKEGRGAQQKQPEERRKQQEREERRKQQEREESAGPAAQPDREMEPEYGRRPEREEPVEVAGQAQPASGEQERPRDEQPGPMKEGPEPRELPVEPVGVEVNREDGEEMSLTMPPAEEMQHGRAKREGRSWGGIAGEGSAVVRRMKEGMESGEIPRPQESEVPYYRTGEFVSKTTKDWSENVGRPDAIEEDESRPDEQKWGRSKRPADRRL